MKNRRKLPSRLCALLLAMALLCSFGVPQAGAADSSVTWSQVNNDAVTAQLPLQEATEAEDVPAYQDTDSVRVSIFLEDAPAISKFDVENIAENQAAVNYRANLESRQAAVAQAISTQVLGGRKLDVVWNLTLAANMISANVEYGKIAAIEKIPGVEQVLVETQYEPAVVDADLPTDPNMSTSSSMIGSSAAWTAGYTGAGSRIAVIDTGTDTDHQSFSAAGFDYSLQKQAEQAGKTVMDYHLLSVEEIAGVLDKLHVHEVREDVTAQQLYLTTKLPFAFNYVDKDLDATHDNDKQGEHGSHVAGISTANTYIPNGDGTFSHALDTVKVQGVAPDAQLITMKVFGKRGGAYDTDYLAAIEDAIVLKCDSVNLSLGSPNPGLARHSNEAYQEILDNLTKCGVVVAMAAGNASSWVAHAQNGGYLYADDVSMDMVGSPGSYTNSLCVASIENVGVTGEYFTVGDHVVVYAQSTGYRNKPLSTLTGEQEYILIDGVGTEEEFQAIADVLEGKIAVCSRGSIAFSLKASYAVENGAAATIIYNNQAGTIGLDLSDYSYTAPCVSVIQADGDMMRAAATPVTDETGNTLYYVGKLTVKEGVGSEIYEQKYNTMSDFSSWGVPGTLEMKPEITAPGGNIYSVNGFIPGGTSYENMSGTSMATPQVAGMAALVAQYIRENGLAEKTNLTPRQLAQSLLMSTAVPQMEDLGEGESSYYPVLRQGAGLANVGDAIAADSYILMGEDATKSYADGKVKVELGDDAEKTGTYEFSFSIHNLTAEEKTFSLSADFFTQGVFSYDFDQDGVLNDYMGTWTAGLDADVTFNVGSSVQVPGNGFANVKVTVKLTDDQKTELNEAYPNGAYIQGFVHAKSGATAEGVKGTAHSIPVLGFYGCWSDASMFEVGTRAEYATGEVDRLPYLGNTRVNAAVITYANNPDSKYYFGGNPLVRDQHYMPERNAINGENGDQISQMVFSVIRHAAESRIAVENLTANKTMLEAFGGSVNPAFYYANAGSWQNTVSSANVNFTPAGASEGEKLELSITLAPEYYVDDAGEVDWNAMGKGTSLRVPMVVDNTAPELRNVFVSLVDDTMLVKASDNQYVAAVVLLNTAGTKVLASTGAVQDIEPGEEGLYTLDLTGVKGKSFLLQVFDYAMNATTYQVSLQSGGEQDVPEMIAFMPGDKVWVGFAKADGYKAPSELAPSQKDFTAAAEVDGMIFAATDQGDLYVLDMDDLSAELLAAHMGVTLSDMAYDKSTETLYAVTGNHLVIVDKLTGAITDVGEIPFQTRTLACDGNGTFYSAVHGDSSEVADRGFVYAYTLDVFKGGNLDYDFDGDGNVDADDGQAILDYATGTRTSLEHIANADFDGSGELTSRDAYLFLEKYGAGQLGDVPTQISSRVRKNVRTLTWNPNNGKLYGVLFTASRGTEYAYFYEIDPGTGTDTSIRDFHKEVTSLVIPQQSSDVGWASPTDQVSGVQISAASITLLNGASETLTASVQPWTATDRSVTWTSANPEIATVNENGVVTGVAPGETVITVASVLNPTATASCTVTVEALNITLKGALQDKDGNPMLFTWDMAKDVTWTPGPALANPIASIAYDAVTDTLYFQDSNNGGWYMHQVDLATGEEIAMSDNSCAFKFAMSDLVSLEQFNTKEAPGMMGVVQNYLMRPCDPMENTFNQGWDVAAELSKYSGGTKFVAAASMGTTTNDEGDLCDLIYALDDVGYLWTFKYNGTGSIAINYIPTDLKLEFPVYEDYQFCSMVQGNDGNLYLSYFTGESNQFYRLVWDAEEEMYTSNRIGDAGDSVWPVALYAVETNESDASDAVTDAGVLDQPIALDAQVLDTQAIAAVASMPNAAADEGEETVTVTITAKNGEGTDAFSNNGMAAVSYDASALELQEVAISGDYTAQVTTTGTVIFGYVSKDGIAAGAPVATLTFAVKAAGNTTLTVTHQELNNGKLSYTEQLPVNLDCPSEAFTDLDTACWYHPYTDYVLSAGLMNGMGNGRFVPNGALTRGMLVTTLYRLAGSPQVEERTSFADVPAGMYFADAVAWAEDNGIAEGMTDTTFAPEGAVTREQAATFLYRYVTEYLEQEPAQGGDLSSFTDAGEISGYAEQAMAWAVAEGFLEGYGDGAVGPRNTLTRAQMAKLLTILDRNF